MRSPTTIPTVSRLALDLHAEPLATLAMLAAVLATLALVAVAG